MKKIVGWLIPIIVGILMGSMCLGQSGGGGSSTPCPNCGTSCQGTQQNCIPCCDTDCTGSDDHFNCVSGCCS